MRQISLFKSAGTRQMHILSTRRDLPAGAGTIIARGDAAFGTKKMIAAALGEGIEFSFTVTRG